MRPLYLFLFVPLLASADTYSAYPTCSQSCLSTADTNHDCASRGPGDCKCSHVPFIEEACACIRSACNDDQQQAVRMMVTGACGAYELPLHSAWDCIINVYTTDNYTNREDFLIDAGNLQKGEEDERGRGTQTKLLLGGINSVGGVSGEL
ncbi:hypothetical protein BDD12DRAFT_878683 [Trichophaea hybrida]|nr:hypothetical protein BDD12DRAFT_878683 [Trichophaea hybrida]